MKSKLKNSGGFSIVELLCAVVILMLLCLMMDTGIQMAMKSYHDVTAESETQLLLSSLSDALSDKLRYAVVTETEDTDGSPLYSSSIGEIKIKPEDGGRVVIDDGTPEGKPLLPEGAYGKGRYDGKDRYEAVTAKVDCTVTDDGEAIFTVELAVREVEGEIGAETTLTVRCLNPPRKPRKEG